MGRCCEDVLMLGSGHDLKRKLSVHAIVLKLREKCADGKTRRGATVHGWVGEVNL